MGNQRYYIRLIVMRRIQGAQKRPNAESLFDWIEPVDGSLHYSAREIVLNAGEEIRQGVKEATSFMRIGIRGRHLPIDETDRIKILVSGQVFRITAKPVVKQRETEILLESV